MLVRRVTFFVCGWLSFATGVIGIFVPVLPTTPLLLLATFLFARSSPRFHAWIQRSGIYQRYVVPFKDSGGLPFGQKLRILVVSFILLGLSAWAVPHVYVWVLLVAVALWLLYLMLIRIPTIAKKPEQD